MQVSVSSFENQLSYLAKNGYTFLFEDEYKITKEKSVILSFDDAFVNFYINVFPLLKKYNAKATVNVITKYLTDEEIAYKEKHLTKSQIQEMLDSGLVNIASHTVNHVDLARVSSDEVEFELKESKATLEKLFNKKIDVLVCPFESLNEAVKQVADKYYKFTYSQFVAYGGIYREYLLDTDGEKELVLKIFDNKFFNN